MEATNTVQVLTKGNPVNVSANLCKVHFRGNSYVPQILGQHLRVLTCFSWEAQVAHGSLRRRGKPGEAFESGAACKRALSRLEPQTG